jgi:hypothetical protein
MGDTNCFKTISRQSSEDTEENYENSVHDTR